MKHSYRNHVLEVSEDGRQTIYDVYERFRGNLRLVLAGFICGLVNEDSLMIRLREKVDKMLSEPPPVLPNFWSVEFRK